MRPFTVEYKAYSAARPIHNAIDAALLLRKGGLRADNVEKIVIERHPDWSEYHRNTSPATFHEAQVSIEYSSAVALIEGQALPPQYSNELLKRPDLVELMSKISVVTVDGLPRGVTCRMVATTKDGNTMVEQVDDPKGSVGNPVSDEELAAKFTWLAGPVVTEETCAKIIALVNGVAQLPNVDELLSLCVAV